MHSGTKLNYNFFQRNPIIVAKELLGKILVRKSGKYKTSGIIVETEAYLGVEDKACHAYNGKMTERTKILFGPVARAYIYPVYGFYYCLNIVSKEPERPAGSVLIRALQPLEGIKIMKKRRNYKQKDIKNLTNGPSKLCIAMNIDKKLNGCDVCGDQLYILDGKPIPKKWIKRAKRVNIDYAGEAKDWLLRFYIKNNIFVSTK